MADKILMVAMLISLLHVGYIYYYAVLLLIIREIFISGLRVIASEYNISLDVVRLAKIKTAAFSMYCVCALWIPHHIVTNVLLWITLFSSLGSALYYVYQLIMLREDVKQ